MAQQQSGQPAAGQPKKKRSNWLSVLWIVSIGGILFLLVWWLFIGFGPKTTYKDVNHFEQRVEVNKDDLLDDNYFSEIKFDVNAHKIYVKESVDGQAKVYTVKATTTYILNWSSQHYISDSSGNPIQNPLYLQLKDARAFRDNDGNPAIGIIGDAGVATTNPWLSLLWSFLPSLLLIGLLVWFFKKNMGMGDSIMNTGKSQARKVTSNKRFSDIAGQEEAKEEVEEVVDFLKNPERYKAAGARVPKGIMLGGPPGTGKTLLAKAVAGEAGVPFFFISASNFVEMFAGLGAKRVREMFKDARRAAPAILFIDELDAIGRKRGSSLSGNDEREQTLNQILVEMDGMDENAGILIIAATNRVDVLDPALLRPGRFDRTITVKNPDIKEREAILKLHAKGKRISKDVDFKNIAQRTPGYSGAELENIINEATLLSVREKTGIITLDQLDEAIDRVAAGPSKKHRVITKQELTMIAYHEAGHAVIGLIHSAAEKVQKITIIPRGDAGGYTLMTPKEEKYNYSKSELEAKIMTYLGGRAAEQIIYGIGEVSTGASNDIVQATAIARAMVTQYGMSILGPIAYERDLGAQYLGSERTKEYSDALAEKIDGAIRELIITAEQNAIKTIKENKDILELIKEELLDKEIIVAEEIEFIGKHKKRPPKREKPVIEDKTSQTLDDLISDVTNTKETKVNVSKPDEEIKGIDLPPVSDVVKTSAKKTQKKNETSLEVESDKKDEKTSEEN